jgi:hypothetical protein
MHVRPEANKQRKISYPRWAAYAACGWALLFAAIHAYWALGGSLGLVPGLSMARGSVLFVIDLVAIPLCIGGAAFALTLVLSWGRSFPRRVLLIVAWCGCAFLVVHAAPTLLQGGLIGAGVLKNTLSPLERWDLMVYEPFWLLGGILFGIAAWFYQRESREQA